ncbi:CLUMA_CG013844, isoform A [Clunio marinus]|uniref:CLUMA_CG013844, isoform A n=1 Tax=Clunio marinus TaxID=568069 RepID=A0A1J1IK77_9DIPT|nr:CLUMA_CG013844, isoform A [Clunio marinus]
MSMIKKPDYFITHNGLPNILFAHNRQSITETKVSTSCDRVLSHKQHQHQQKQQNIHALITNKRFSDMESNQQAHVMQFNEKNIRNREIKESLRHNNKTAKDLINMGIVRSSSCNRRNEHSRILSATTKFTCADNNEFYRKSKRSQEVRNEANRGNNKLTYQRKYDNTIFRHDLPDRIVLPPLPI